ncbi:hypothetical protein LOTGIDRAFT_154772 [Lottia gigantea]|uniref:Apple domain-containing protein n=1 Tax=Lottia gigantea TaxID=225164 RepID=V3ZSC2_LOTGI|nr:hypothetical protein LOTGIDRAFT_154772 [Lottia gigantea]ESO87272.1 hypothetical protein LOTGIDRAFT_154772 [Lottia gigantea]
MNKCLCSVLLVLVGIWLTTVGFTDAVQCTSDPVIINGALDSDITSREVGAVYDFTCGGTLEDMGTVTCNGTGDWTTSWTCEECYLLNSYFIELYSYIPGITNSAGCDVKCEELNCAYRRFTRSPSRGCYVSPSYVIFQIAGYTLQRCIDKCDEMEECLSLRETEGYCYLFSETVPSLVDLGNEIKPHDWGTIIGKRSTCPST